ncbi:glycosyltransferase family 2 protein [Salegentibacter chungangensis]|uniref:Glycosyltransferase family 2 protein n=1 Tax=Salegentibacter chungangensis TaxID=1335724 RepID=A0ABW3NSC2_9FLAO
MKSVKVALLISTYCWPEALRLVLKSLLNQSILPDEVVIADDGSADDTAEVIREFNEKAPMTVRHIWHEDDGFRRTVILNKAISKIESDYIIQLDGDCIMHEKFVENHLNFSQNGNFLFGSRVNIQKHFLPKLFAEERINFHFFSRGIKKRTRNIHSPALGGLYKEKDELSKKVRGCNLSFWKDDILKVNGYNEDMTGWGKEDSELVVRLLNKGVKGRRLRYNAIIYHIWHKEASRHKHNINFQIQEEAIKHNLTSCENGINKYL